MAEQELKQKEKGKYTMWQSAGFMIRLAIRERENPRLRMSNMPKRYWGTMTEFQTGPAEPGRKELQA